MINIEEEYIGLLSGVLHGGKEKADTQAEGNGIATLRAIFSPKSITPTGQLQTSRLD